MKDILKDILKDVFKIFVMDILKTFK